MPSKKNCDNEVIETAIEHRERIRSHYIVYFTQFNIIFSYSSLLPGMWPLLSKLDPTATKTFHGIVVSSSALGQTLFSPLIGLWSNRLESTRIPFVIAMVTCTISHLIYASLERFESHRKYWLLFSRLLAGIGSSSITICRSHISTTTLVEERRSAVSILSSCGTIGLALGPAIQWAVVYLGDDGFWFLGLKVDIYSSVAWILTVLYVVNAIFFCPSLFKEHNMLKKQMINSENNEYDSSNYKMLAWAFIGMNFIMTFNIMFTKVLATQMVMDKLAMTGKEATELFSIVMTGSAFISFIIMLLINPLCKLTSEIKILIIGIVLMIIGRSAFYPLGKEATVTYDDRIPNAGNITRVGCPLSQKWCSLENKMHFWQFICGNVFENIGYSLAITLIMAIFSKVLGSKPQGTWMGLLTACGSIGRIGSPVIITTIYYYYGTAVVTVITNAIFIVSITLLGGWGYKYMKKKDIQEEAIDHTTPNREELEKTS